MRIIVLVLLIFSLFSLSSCRPVDVGGVVASSDVDQRFNDSAALAAKPDVSIAPGDFSFVVIADPHVYQRSNANLTILRTKLSATDKFILVCGDLTQCGSAEDLAALTDALGQTGLPYYTTIGNHDLFYGGWANYRQALGRSCYTFAAGPARVISMDSANGTLGSLQKSWLENVLGTKTEPLCFVFTHCEFFNPSFPGIQQYTDIAEIYYLMHLFETHGVNNVFMGHSHRDYDRQVNQVNYINLADLTDDGSRKAFVRVHISAANVIRYERVEL